MKTHIPSKAAKTRKEKKTRRRSRGERRRGKPCASQASDSFGARNRSGEDYPVVDEE
jgi:hypothetical protein